MSINENQKEFLEQIIEQLGEDKKLAQKNLNRNLVRISELNISIKSLMDKNGNEVDVFSARNFESIENENLLKKLNEEKELLEEKNRDDYEAINRLNILLNKLYSFESENSIYKIVSKKNDNKFNSFLLLETDRQRIAKDLHDTSLQNLTAVVHKIELASMYINQDPIRAKLELSAVSKSIKETINEIRDTIFELRPMSFDDLGFKELLDDYIEKEFRKSNINVIFDKYSVSTNNQSLLMFTFRLIKEFLCNCSKHSKCTEVHLILDDSSGNSFKISIKDNGIGFNIDEKELEKNKHFGLIIAKERVKLMNGTIDINSSINNGTSINVSLPISNNKGE